MNNSTLQLSRIINVTHTNKSKTRIALELCTELPATLEISYSVRDKHGKVGTIYIKNIHTGHRIKLHPHIVAQAIARFEYTIVS